MRQHRRGSWIDTRRELGQLAWAVLLFDAIAVGLGALAARPMGPFAYKIGIGLAAAVTVVFALLVGGNLLIEALHNRWVSRRRPPGEEALKRSEPGRLIIICGLPGSGKTTLAQSLESRLRAVRLSPDDWMHALGINLHDADKRARIEAFQWTLAQQLLTLGQVVIIEWGTWARSERDTLRLGARALGASVELRFVSAPRDVLIERINRRARENPPIAPESLSQWLDSFQPPTEEEMALFDSPLAP